MCKCTDFLTYLVSSSTIELLDLCLFSEEERGVVQLSKEHSRFENWVTKMLLNLLHLSKNVPLYFLLQGTVPFRSLLTENTPRTQLTC
jgi:hypothetical protein